MPSSVRGGWLFLPGRRPEKGAIMVQNNNNNATINIDAFLLSCVTNQSEARNLLMKLGWRQKEEDQLTLHRNGQPQMRLVELEQEDKYFIEAGNACKKALLDLNRAYHNTTGRYVVKGLIKTRENLDEILDMLLAL